METLRHIKICFIRDLRIGKPYLLASCLGMFVLTLIYLWSNRLYYEANPNAAVQLAPYNFILMGCYPTPPNTQPHIPYSWLGFLLIFISTPALYVATDLRQLHNNQIFTRVDRSQWLFSKVLWSMLTFICITGSLLISCWLLAKDFLSAVRGHPHFLACGPIALTSTSIIMSPSVTLTLLSLSYKDPCHYIEST